MTNDELSIGWKGHDKDIHSLEKRMKAYDEQQKIMLELVRSVEMLATNMKNMLGEQREQGKRILRLEQAPLDDYRHYKRLIAGCVVTGILGTAIGALLSLIIK